MGKTKVLLDTNILISALGWNGKPRELFQKCLTHELELITSTQQLEELERVLNYPKFNFTELEKDTFLTIILEIATIVSIGGNLNIIKEDLTDNLLLETALVGNVNFLISGDPHLLNLKEFARIKIITANEFLLLDLFPS